MELIRVILVITGVVLLGIAFMMGRKKTKSDVFHRARPAAYDPSIDELSVPVADVVPDEDWQTELDTAAEFSPDTRRPAERPAESSTASAMVFDADSELSDDEIDAALPSGGNYRDPVQTEIEISREFGEIDLDVDVDETPCLLYTSPSPRDRG